MQSIAPESYQPNQVEFSGKGSEYFGIWIVNLFLTIITLGIYSAWAKVRNNQYLHGHTKIDGHSFRYLATPWEILRGRLIAFALFVVYAILTSVSPVLAIILGLLFIIAIPWIILQGLRFNMRMTSYRNVRFSFKGSYGDIFITFILLPIASVFTLYLIFPWVLKRMDQYIVNNITYGGKPFQCEIKTSNYYIAALAAFAAGVLVALILGLLMGGILGINLTAAISHEAAATGTVLTTLAFLLVYWVGFTLVSALYQAMIRNHLYNNSQITEVATFDSDMSAVSYTVLIITNTLLLVFTLGLAWPVTQIRKARYLASVTTVNVSEQVSDIIDQINDSTGALGEEAAGFFDVDLSIG
jgi:uncharacterized membrane protein YjgN (DUF898 family)